MEEEIGSRVEAPVSSSSADATAELPNADSILDVLNTRDWLDSQNYDLSVALKAEKLDLLETQDVEELQERIAALRTDLFKISSDQTVKELILKRARFDQALSDKLFSMPLPLSTAEAENADTEQNKDASDREKYEVLLQEKSKVTSAIFRKSKDVADLQKELDAIRKRNYELKKTNRRLMGVLGQHRKTLEKMADNVKSNSACKELKEELESTVSRVEIAKCTLQALIVGSGVNWAEDPGLVDTVLLCGDSLHL
ncbi:centromere protein H-like [Babylonia areolata]|uniref:centromere protein H-like n=1 Tax=Babylonia areolata TaxID=304850 RepID=UPI003FD4735B